MQFTQLVWLTGLTYCLFGYAGFLSAEELPIESPEVIEQAVESQVEESSSTKGEASESEQTETENKEPETSAKEEPRTIEVVKSEVVVVEGEPKDCDCGEGVDCDCETDEEAEEKSSNSGALFRYRYMDEDNRLRPDGPDRSTYNLWRLSAVVNFEFDDLFEIYLQGIDATNFDENMPAMLTDVNRSDLAQGYGDLKLIDHGSETLHFRFGRQFLEYGSERLVSHYEWVNTFRNFDGFKLYYEGVHWKVDGFVMQSVNAAAGNEKRQPTSFDNPDENRWFSGLYTTYQGLNTGPIDFYWLWLRDDEPAANRLDGNRHTFGSRWEGTLPDQRECDEVERTWIWDIEAAWQWGSDDFQGITDGEVSAGFVSLMAGHVWNHLDWSPSIQGGFYWASGDDNPNDDQIKTFSPLYPDAHTYWGILDNLNGSNLIDYSLQASVHPAKGWTFSSAFHWFLKAEAADFIYDVAGNPLGPNGTDREIGNELDFVMTYQTEEKSEYQIGISTFWYGDAVTETALNRPDAQQIYFMYSSAF